MFRRIMAKTTLRKRDAARERRALARLVVALAAKHAPKALRTFTARFPDGVDESQLANEVAARYGTEHTVIDVDGYDAAKHLWTLAWYAEEPLNDAALLPNFLIERALGEHVTVSLNGTGGDERQG